jgi:hypothetical protein
MRIGTILLATTGAALTLAFLGGCSSERVLEYPDGLVSGAVKDSPRMYRAVSIYLGDGPLATRSVLVLEKGEQRALTDISPTYLLANGDRISEIRSNGTETVYEKGALSQFDPSLRYSVDVLTERPPSLWIFEVAGGQVRHAYAGLMTRVYPGGSSPAVPRRRGSPRRTGTSSTCR